VEPPSWQKNLNKADSYLREFMELADAEGFDERPTLVYITSTDKKIVERVRGYESSTLVDEKFYIAARFFDCYQVDINGISEEHALLKLVKKPKPMSFFILFDGKIIYRTKDKPSVNSLFGLCAKALKKTHGIALDKIAKEEQKLLTAIDKLNTEMDKIREKRTKKGKKISKREDLSLQKNESQIQEKLGALKEEEKKLFILPPSKIAKKKTARK